MNLGLPNSVDEMTDIIENEGLVIPATMDLIQLLLAILAIAAVVVVIIFLIKWVYQRFLKDRVRKSSPEQRAERQIKKRLTQKMIQEQNWRLFYFNLDEIFRHYLDERYHIDVLDKTHEEIKSDMSVFETHFNQRERDELAKYWERAQLSKFAGSASTSEQAKLDQKLIENLINKYRSQAQPQKKKEGAS